MSDRVAYFSICSLNYLHHARTLAQSLVAADPSIDFHLFIADRWDERIVQSAPEPQIIALNSLGIPYLLDMAFRYELIEFNTALKPFCIEFLFDQRGYNRVIYLDPDIFVLKPLTHVAQIFAEGAECILTPHITRPIDDGRLPSELDLLRAGAYNLGFCAFANCPDARSFIAWWRGKLASQCLLEPNYGIFVDQRYCDFAPAFVARAAILRHPGYNLAYWNLTYRLVTNIDGEYRTRGEPVHFVHFSGIEPQNPGLVSKHQDRFRRSDLGDFGPLYDHYLGRLIANNRGPDGPYSDIPYGFGEMRSGLRVEPWMRRYYRAVHRAPVNGNDPFSLTMEFFAPAKPKPASPPESPPENTEALTQLSRLAGSPKLLTKSLLRVLWKGQQRGANYWQRRAVPPSPPEVASTSAESASPLARGTAIYGFFSASTGNGQAVRDASLALRSADYPVSCHDILPLGHAAATEPFDIEPGFANGFDTALLWLNADNTLLLDRLVPAQALMGRRCIGHWVWELPVFPAAWARAFDRIEEVWVPSAYVAASVAAATTKPVRIVPYVVHPPTGLDRAAVRAHLGVQEDEILFTCVFDQRSYCARKNPRAVVLAFIDAFPDPRTAVRLLVKCHGEPDASLRELAALVQNRPAITLIGSTLSREAIWQLHAACDIHVSLHRAEGFGLNIAEAMALGKLAIVTNFSGNTDFTTSDNALLVDFDMRRVALHDYPYGEGQWWADPRHDAAVAAMRTAYREAALRRRLGERARQDIQRLSMQAVGYRMAGLLGNGPDFMSGLIRTQDFDLGPSYKVARFNKQSWLQTKIEEAKSWYRVHGRKVVILIPSYRDTTLLHQCINSVQTTTNPTMIEILVVDDASADESHLAFLTSLPKVHGNISVIFGDKNVGFAGNVNRGLKVVSRDVVLMNSDVVAQEGWLEVLQYTVYSTDSAIGTSRLLYESGSIQFAGGMRSQADVTNFDHFHRIRPPDYVPALVSAYTFYATGAVMYLRLHTLKVLSYFDPAYAMTFEDVDYCVRAWSQGLRVVYAPASCLNHKESATRGIAFRDQEKCSQDLFWKKQKSFFERNIRNCDGKPQVIFVCETTGVGGGHRVIYNFLNHLSSAGFDAQLWNLEGCPDWFPLRPSVTVRVFGSYHQLAEALDQQDAIKVATWWKTSEPVWLGSVRRGIPVYLVQDIESSYYTGRDDVTAIEVLSRYRPEFNYATITEWVKSELATSFNFRAVCVGVGYQDDKFHPLSGTPRRKRTILVVARGEPLKNFAYSQDILRQLSREGVQVLAYGIDRHLVQELGSVEFFFKPSDDELCELYNQADFFLQTSRHEGFSLPPVEAMACGCAVVTTDAMGNREYICDGENCIVIPIDNSREAVRKILAALADDQLQQKIRAGGAQTAKLYAQNFANKRAEKFFRAIVSRPEYGCQIRESDLDNHH